MKGKVNMEQKDTVEMQVWITTPFERPDIGLASAAAKAGAFPVLHLGYDQAVAEAALNELAAQVNTFGISLPSKTAWEVAIPGKVSKIILPWGENPPKTTAAEIIWQVKTAKDAKNALAAGAKTLILKGAEGAGFCGEDSSFILFQKVIQACKDVGAAVFVQGGAGVHGAAAYMALGAAGIVLDSQVALFPECGLSQEDKTALSRLSGTEIRVCGGYHYHIPLGSNEPADILEPAELLARIGTGKSDILPLGQDIILAPDLVGEYKRLKQFVRALKRACVTHTKQARTIDAFAPGSEMAKILGTVYPLAQGPMARISDTPAFLHSVAKEGALPFLAMSMDVGEAAEQMLAGTAAALAGKPWGAGILGFAFPKVLAEQTKLILEAKPSFVLIAGGRPGQGTVFEQAGIKTLLHAPTPGLLDMFLKEGSCNFIFEGRESGGHVGPLFSTVLWEKQLNKILKMDNPAKMGVFFAGGIHDALSAAFVRVMAGPLTARGVKAGLLCGTAYLYTQEAVEQGAISQDYQRLLIEKNQTLLLKSGNGQETRCVQSPFTDYFLEEKTRMEKEDVSPIEMILRLEALNLGRLRIAAKGLALVDDKFVPLPENEQLQQGLYMTGTVTELKENTTTLADLHHSLIGESLKMLSEIVIAKPAPALTSATDIAVIGMAGIFPGAENLDEFWRNILFGVDCITEVPQERWPVDIFYDPDAKDTDHVMSKWGGFIGKTDFNALEFGITPQSLALIEPAQLLALLLAKRALEDAGFVDLASADLEDTTVIIGTEGGSEELAGVYHTRALFMRLLGELPKELDEAVSHFTEDSFPGVLNSIIAGRISNRLNTGGRNYIVDAACATSLAALDIAVTELNTKKANMVILGGADLHNGIIDYLMFASTHALSYKGRCATFDAEADGVALGEGIGVVILKRLEDAKRDSNKIYAVIKGVGGSSDGKHLGLTAPSMQGQILALERAYESANVSPSEVGFIEAHGTGTVVGDRVELQALNHVFLEDGTKPGQVNIGSIKSNIGHTKCAAGIAGLIKAVYCVQHGLLPPTLHLKNPNEAYAKTSPFAFRTEKTGYWPEGRRIAGLSSFGFGGTNFHAIIENYEKDRPKTPLKAWPAELFVFPGDSAQEAESLMEKVEEMLALNDKLRLIDIAYSLAARCGSQSVHYAIVAGTRSELIARMNKARAGTNDENIYRLKAVPGKVAFLFPGQGSQRVNMAADLFLLFPRMRRLLDGLPEYERILFPNSVFTDADKKAQREELTDTRNAQPILGMVDLAIAELLKDFGIKPDLVAGHSYGELPALCYAGAFAAEDLVGLSRARAEAILGAAKDDLGRMAAVFSDKETLEKLLEGEKEIWAVNFNAPRQTVIAGTDAGLEAFLAKAKAAGITCNELNVACAFHSPLLKGADQGFAAVLKDIEFHAPGIPVMSNTDAGFYPVTAAEIRERLAAHLVNPVRFTQEIEQINREGATVFVEAGPGGALTKLTSEILKGKDIAIIHTEQSGENGLTFLLRGFAKYIATGRMIKMDELFSDRDAVALNIDAPESYKKEGIVWSVDGRIALPENSEPAHTKKQMKEMNSLSDWMKAHYISDDNAGNGDNRSSGNAEQVLLSYLENMNTLIQDQRDVMLGYMGAFEVASRRAAPRRQFDISTVEAPALLPEKEEQPLEQATDELPDILSLSSEQITAIIFDVVSEKTGYPISMLNLDMDLEADLSIDSIKKMEIVGGLLNRIKIPQAEEGMEAYFEKIISVRKFRDLTAWIEEIGQNGEGGLLDQAAPQVVSAQLVADFDDKAPVEKENIIRLTFSETACPIEEKDLSRVVGKTFVLPDDGNGLAAKVAQALIDLGAQARIIDTEETTDLSDSNGIILINSSTAVKRNTVLDLFGLLKKANMDELQWVFVFDDSPALAAGTLEKIEQPTGSIELPDGFPGFLKSLAHEYSGKRFCAVQFETHFDPETFAGIVTDELTAIKPLPELFYRNEERFFMLPKINGAKLNGKAPQAVLDEDSVVIVLGGAQGITPHIIGRLANDISCQFILIGRSAQESENVQYVALETVDDIRKHLIEHEGMAIPREVEAKAKHIYKSKQINAALARIEQDGAKARYIQADVTDREAFAELLTKIKSDYGKIDGLIHAAGILEDKYFRDKEADSFARVYNTKVMPLQMALDNLLPDLKLLVLFSSISSAFGNAGQCDYAAGNSVLDNTVRVLKRQRPDLKATAFNWGPWRGAGMVNPGIENEFRKRGISFIDINEGSELFMHELNYGDEASILAIAIEEKAVTDLLEKHYGDYLQH
jgi:acyl transferase domain-containing protein/NAD(P)H-dependent flavin oxidoreductase YrpB (nitropropane dioxygenase family)/NAD(P)-dependent dehydrogenase (short-subunit alcohol dehydrogenase family)